MGIHAWIKRKRFFAKNSWIYRLYQEVKRINQIPGNAYTLQKLNEIKTYAIHHCKFYSQFSPEDAFPVMTKLDFINYKDEICSDEVFDQPLHTTSTSGSTGVPFVVNQDFLKRSRTIADLKVYGEYAGYKSHEKMLQLRAYNGKTLDRSVDRRENIWRYDISYLNDENMPQFISFVKKWKPKIIFGYVSTLEMICDFILNNGQEYDFGCKSVLVGAEMLSAQTAEKIKKVFRCPVYDRYSNMEMGIYAQREYGKSNFIINKASYYFEVLKLDSDESAEEHEIGRLVFTDLHNHAFPMIRYDTGDVGSYCMNNGNMELEIVYGRRVDAVYNATGKMISPHSITNGMWGVRNVAQWQFVQLDHGTYLLKISAAGPVDEEDILSRLKAQVGETAKVRLEYVDEIPVLRSQKRKYIVNAMTGR